MIIVNGCATLRAIEEKDAEILYEMMNSPEIERTTVGANQVVSLASQQAWAKNQKNDDTQMRFMVELENHETVGMVTLNPIDWKNRCAFVSYKISAQAQGRIKGDMYDAVSGLINYAFEELNLNRIDASILDFNVFSLKLAHKLGFVDEGIQRQRIFKSGSYHDEIILGLLKSEWKGI
ncbi:MAG: GNAT family protein [Oscillospiraceae bacterium]